MRRLIVSHSISSPAFLIKAFLARSLSRFVGVLRAHHRFFLKFYSRAQGLFGSFARGNFHDFSDIDIFIETGDKFVKNMGFSKGILYYDMLKKQISNKFGVLVDLSDIASMSIDEKKEFLKDAINV